MRSADRSSVQASDTGSDVSATRELMKLVAARVAASG